MPSAAPVLRVLPSTVHGGIDKHELLALGVEHPGVLDFSANQSPSAPSLLLRTAVAETVLHAYPDRDALDFCRAAAAYHSVDPEQVVAGNGTTELIRLLAQLVLREDDTALALSPAFAEYSTATLLARARFRERRLSLENGVFAYDHEAFLATLHRFRPRLCWLCSPHNPTGSALPPAAIADMVAGFPETLFVLDEAYCDLLDRPQWTPDILALGNLVVLRSLTKAWGLAGLRLGYSLSHPSPAAALRAAKPPWNVNACAQAAGEAILRHPAPYHESVRLLREGRAFLTAGLRAQGWTVLPSAACFFLVEVRDAAALRQRLLDHGCLVRDCSSFGLPRHVRVSPRLPAENERLLAAFATATDLRPAVPAKGSADRGAR